jgi:hypothetical protein
MANNVIQIKRSAASAAPGSLAKGELAWVDHGTGGAAGILYVGDMTGAGAAIRKIGGPGWGLELLANTALTGIPTAPTALQAIDNTQVATTAFVHAAVVANAVPIAQASDTDISGQTAGHVLIWDGTDSWDNKALSGDVSIDQNGVTIVGGVAANSIALGADTTGNYVSTITGTNNEIEVTNGAGSEGAAVIIGLPDNVTVTGNLTVNGSTTTVDSTVVTVADPIFTLGANLADSKDRGIAMKYGAAAKFSWMGMDESDDKFKYIADATNTGEVITGSLGNAAFGTIDGTLTTASQPNITGIGTIGTGVWEGTAVSTEYGGTGQDFSNSNGVLSITGGTMSVASEMPVTLGGTGLQAVTAEGMLVGAGTADMTILAIGSTGQHMSVSSGGSPEWSDSVDGGTF